MFGWLGKIHWNIVQNEDFYSHLNMEDITDRDYTHARRVWKDFGIKNFRDYHDLFVQRNILMLPDVFENQSKINDKKRYRRRNMSLYLSICKS